MNEESNRTARFIFLGLVAGLVLMTIGVGIGWLLEGGLSGQPSLANATVVSASALNLTATSEAARVRFTPRATFTPLPSMTATPATPTPALETAPTPDPNGPASAAYVKFRVQADALTLYQGPGDGYPLVGSVSRDSTLLVAGRTGDGSWWLVCCWEQQVGWIPLQGDNVLVEGDVGTVDVLDVPIRMQSSPALPTAPPQPTLAALLAATAPPAAGAPPAATEPTAAPAVAPPAPTTAPAPPASASFEPPRRLDSRLPALGVAIEPANVAPGQPYWRVVEIVWHDEGEAGGRHSIFADVVDEQGNRILGQPVTVRWPDGSQQLTVENKPLPEYGVNYPMYAAGQSYSVQVDGLPSDRVHGLGLGDLNQRDWNVHVEYLIKFQRAIR